VATRSEKDLTCDTCDQCEAVNRRAVCALVLLLQVDTDEVDRLSGRVRVNRSKFANRYGSTTTQKPATQSTTTPSTATARRESDSTATHRAADAEKLNEVEPQQPTAQPAVPLPKQSGFVPRQRMFSYGGDRNTDVSSSSGSNQTAATTVPAAKTSTAAKPEADADESAPAQTSFLQRRLNKEKQRQEEMKLKLKEFDQNAKAAAASHQQSKDNISLQDSIEKVKSWKEQLGSSSPSTATPPSRGAQSDELDINALIGGDQDEWRKKKPIGRPGQYVSEESANDGKQPSQPPPSSSSSKKTFTRKTFGGVPSFPDESECVSNDRDSTSRLTVPKSRVDRSPSPYDNVKNQRPASPYDNCKPSSDSMKQNVYPSMESLAGFAGDVSGSSDDESNSGVSTSRATHHQKPGGRNISNKAVASSLPDLVTSSEGGRSPILGSSKFIGRVQDIDSLLGFGETEDETDDIDDDNGSIVSAPCRTEFHNGRTPVEMPMSPDGEQGPMSYTHLLNSMMYGRDSQDGRIFIGDVEDIDAVFGNDLVPASLGSSSSVLGSSSSTAAPAAGSPTKTNFGSPLHVVISQQQSVDLGSSDSLLDTPVPDTPDIPLSPVPAFFVGESNPKDDKSSAAPNERTVANGSAVSSNNGDLADLSTDVGYADSEDDRKSFDALDGKSNGSRADDGNSRQLVIDGVPTATLVDLDFTQSSDTSDDEEESDNEAAVAAIAARQAAKGHVTIGDMIDVCRREEQSYKPPWIEEEEDRRFLGYNNVTEALESMNINVRKVKSRWWHRQVRVARCT
jgi:hypothetical protein